MEKLQAAPVIRRGKKNPHYLTGKSVDRIHSKKPASSWEYAMVSGNGIHGAMVFGHPSQETIIVNHERLYLPRRYAGDPLEVTEHLKTLRNIIRNEGYAEGLVYLDTKAAEKGLRAAVGNPAFHPAFEVSISTATHGKVRDYVRETDFRTGEATVRFKDDKASFQRRLFVSRKDNFIVFELTSSESERLFCEIKLGNPTHSDVSTALKTSKEGFVLTTTYLYCKGGYDGALNIAFTDGQIKTKDNLISISKAQKIIMLMRVAPWASLEHSDAESLFAELARENKSYEDHLSAHIKIHSGLYDRVSIDLDGSDQDRNSDIDTLLESSWTVNNPGLNSLGKESGNRVPLLQIGISCSHGTLSPALLEKIYNAGRYMSICCSGSLPPNLQGIWTGTWDSPWGGGYVWDTNLQLAIASVMSCNMKELQESYFRLIEMVLPAWWDNAKRIGGCRGIFASGAFSPGVNPHAAEKHTYGHWSWMFGAGYAGWLARIFYDYWLYTGDADFLLKRLVPLLKEISFFYEDWLFLDETGHFRFSPACSPENADRLGGA